MQWFIRRESDRLGIPYYDDGVGADPDVLDTELPVLTPDLASDPTTHKYSEYRKLIPTATKELHMIDDFLWDGVQNELLTWSDKAKKDRRHKGSGSKKKGKHGGKKAKQVE